MIVNGIQPLTDVFLTHSSKVLVQLLEEHKHNANHITPALDALILRVQLRQIYVHFLVRLLPDLV